MDVIEVVLANTPDVLAMMLTGSSEAHPPTARPLTMNLAGQLLALGRAEMAAVLVYALAAPAYCAASRNPVKAQNKLEVESARENTFST